MFIMKEYSEIEVRRLFPIGSVWSTEWGNVTVLDHIPDNDGMGYIVEFKFQNEDIMGIHPHFVSHRVN
jgi:hypothetical protein